jgi:hypothetical protein
MTLTSYFEDKAKELPKPKYQIGDRVFGRYENIPFIGSVLGDTNKRVKVQLDLSFKYNDKVVNFVEVEYNQISRLQEL